MPFFCVCFTSLLINSGAGLFIWVSRQPFAFVLLSFFNASRRLYIHSTSTVLRVPGTSTVLKYDCTSYILVVVLLVVLEY